MHTMAGWQKHYSCVLLLCSVLFLAVNSAPEFSLDKAVTFQEPNESNGIELTKDEDQLLAKEDTPEPEDSPLDMEQEEAVKLERKLAEADDGEDNALQQDDDEEQITVQRSRYRNKCGYIRICARRGRYCSYKYAILRVYQGLAASQLATSDNGNMPDQPDEPAAGEDEDNALQQGSRYRNKCGYIRVCAKRGRHCSYKYAILRVYQGLSAAQLADSNDENMSDQPTDEPSDGEDKNNVLQQGDSNEDQLSAQSARYANKCGYVRMCSRRGRSCSYRYAILRIYQVRKCYRYRCGTRKYCWYKKVWGKRRRYCRNYPRYCTRCYWRDY